MPQTILSLAIGSTNWRHIRKAGATYTRPVSGDRYVAVAAGYTERMFSEFSISGLAGQTVRGVQFRYTIYSTTAPDATPVHFRDLAAVQPSAAVDNDAGNQSIYDGIVSGDLLMSENILLTLPSLPWTVTTNLGSDAVANLQTAIDASQAWWAVGVMFKTELGTIEIDFAGINGAHLLVLTEASKKRIEFDKQWVEPPPYRKIAL